MRLLSYNIHKGIGGRDRRYALPRIIEVIEAENPDIICLEEVDRHVRRSHYDDQPKLLAERFRFDAADFQLNVHVGDRGGGYGNLVLSRWPIIRHHHVSLRFNRRKPRGAQVVVVDTPEGSLHLVHWHLGLAEVERQWQVAHLLTHASYRESSELPTILFGDFNDWRNQIAHRALANVGFTQVTAPPSQFRSFPAWMALGSLDKAFVRGAIQVPRARIVRTAMSRVASDHLPLVVDLHLGETPLE